MKVRLDKLLVDKGLVETRSKALGLIMAGHVLVNGHPVTKAGSAIEDDSPISIKAGNALCKQGCAEAGSRAGCIFSWKFRAWSPLI